MLPPLLQQSADQALPPASVYGPPPALTRIALGKVSVPDSANVAVVRVAFHPLKKRVPDPLMSSNCPVDSLAAPTCIAADACPAVSVCVGVRNARNGGLGAFHVPPFGSAS